MDETTCHACGQTDSREMIHCTVATTTYFCRRCCRQYRRMDRALVAALDAAPPEEMGDQDA